MQLDPDAVAAGYRLRVHETLASTNAEALAGAGAEHDAAGPLWITARQQTAGRGRRGNEWVSTPGNLYATLLLENPAPAANAPQLSFVAALAVHDAIVRCAPGLRGQLALKWPNDVLCGGGKLAGILIEGQNLGFALAVAIGIGVNCVSHPPQASFPATDLAAAGAEVSAETLFFALSGAMMRRLDQWSGGDGFAAIRADWLECAVGLGDITRVRLPGREFAGRFEALDAGGRLVLRLADGSAQTIAAGDVFPVTSAGPKRFIQPQTRSDGAE
jgi:BirA family transcriptional regulator, biotin operon repressor / biotin---[acetyl-CoA-carboxylase] ligase